MATFAANPVMSRSPASTSPLPRITNSSSNNAAYSTATYSTNPLARASLTSTNQLNFLPQNYSPSTYPTVTQPTTTYPTTTYPTTTYPTTTYTHPTTTYPTTTYRTTTYPMTTYPIITQGGNLLPAGSPVYNAQYPFSSNVGNSMQDLPKKRKFLIKKHTAGCCGGCNPNGLCDKSDGACGCLNCNACCDRDRITYKKRGVSDASVEVLRKVEKGCC